MFDIGIRISSL